MNTRTVYTNVIIFTADGPEAAAFLVKDDRFGYVGSEA